MKLLYKKINGEFFSKKLSSIIFFLYWPIVISGLIFLAIFLTAVIANANWRLGDDHQILRTIASNKSWPMSYQNESGRFFPLLYIDFEPLRLFRLHNVPIAFYFISAFKALITVIAILEVAFIAMTEKECKFKIGDLLVPTGRGLMAVIATCLFMITPHVYEMFADVIFNEGLLLPLLSLFLLFLVRYIEGRNILNGYLSLIFGTLACYVKEPTFLILFTIGFFGGWFPPLCQRYFRWFRISLMASAILFLVLYCCTIFIFSNFSGFYGTGSALGRGYFQIFSAIVTSHSVILLGLLTLSFRFGLALLKKASLGLFDLIGLSGAAYVFSFVILRMDQFSYLLPAYIFILPFLLHSSYLVYKTGKIKFLVTTIAFSSIFAIPYLNAPTFFYSQVSMIQTSRMNDANFINSLANKDVCFFTNKSIDPNSGALTNALDDWAKALTEYFIDFETNGISTGKSYIRDISKYKESDQSAECDLMLVPRRLDDGGKLPPGFKRDSSYFYFDIYRPKTLEYRD